MSEGSVKKIFGHFLLEWVFLGAGCVSFVVDYVGEWAGWVWESVFAIDKKSVFNSGL